MAIFSIFQGGNALMTASVVAFVAFVLVARLLSARQSVALAFGLAPFFALLALEGLIVAFA